MGCWPSKPTVHQGVQEIQDVIGILTANIVVAERKQAELRRSARAHARDHNRPRAMYFLRRAKLHEHQILILQQRVLTCTNNIITLKNMHMASIQLKAIHGATRVFRDFTRQHDLDRVEQLQEELEDGCQHVLEISNMLQNDMGDMDFDESELEHELNELEMVDLPLAPDVPLSTPNITPPSPTQTCRLAL